MNNKLVSIIIPVFNGEKYIEEAINSALVQSYKNIEIIVVNDGSSDNTRNICLTYNDKIRYFEKDNGGVSSALNLGIQNMKGEYFSWLSHDDLYYSDKIEKQYNYIITKPDNTIVYSHEDIIDANGIITRKGTTFPILKNTIAFELLHNRFIGGCSLLIPKSAFTSAGLFNEKMRTTQDYDLWFRFLIKGYTFEYLPITSGASRVHENQVSVVKRDLCNTEIERDFINIINVLPRELIVDNNKKEAEVFYNLALQFKKNNEKKISSHCLKIGDSIKQRNKNVLLKYRVILYKKLPFVTRALSYIKRRLLKVN